MTTEQPYAPPHVGQPYSADDTPAPGSRDRAAPFVVYPLDRSGSPRWLQIVRDALLSLAAAVFVASVLYVALTIANARSSLEEFGNEIGNEPLPTSETCTDPDVPWCVPVND